MPLSLKLVPRSERLRTIGGAQQSLGFGEGFLPGLFSFVGAHGLRFLVDTGNGVEKQLRQVADGESIAAVDALASELFGDVGEERVDAFGGVEIAGAGEEIGGENFGIRLQGGLRLAKVVRTEGFVGDAKHVAMVAARGEVLALVGDDEFGGDWFCGDWFCGHDSSFR